MRVRLSLPAPKINMTRKRSNIVDEIVTAVAVLLFILLLIWFFSGANVSPVFVFIVICLVVIFLIVFIPMFAFKYLGIFNQKSRQKEENNGKKL